MCKFYNKYKYMEKNHCCYGLVLVCLLLIYLIGQTDNTEGWKNWISNLFGFCTLKGFSKEHTEAPYKNNCLTCKPFGYQHLPYQYFKNFGKQFPRKYRHCTQYGCKTTKQNGLTAVGKAQWKDVSGINPVKTAVKDEISPDYYHNPYQYCLRNPDKYPCPNYWIKNKELVESRRLGKRPSQCMYVPGLKKGVKPQVETHCKKDHLHEVSTCSVNDNSSYMPIHPGHADQALCGHTKRGCQN